MISKVVAIVLEWLLALWLLYTATFFLLRSLPAVTEFNDDVLVSDVVLDVQKNKVSYVESLIFFVKGDFGSSILHANKKVSSLILQSLKNTFFLNMLALVLILLTAILLALFKVYWQQHRMIFLLDQLLIALIAMPSLWLAPVLIFFLSFKWDLLPLYGLSSIWHYILPLTVLVLKPAAYYCKILAFQMQQELKSQYVVAAKAKGLSDWYIISRHILKKSFAVFVVHWPGLIAGLFAGSFIVEYLFSISGLGILFVDSVQQRDLHLALGITMLYGVLLITFSKLSDVLLKIVNPQWGRSS